MCMKHSLDFQRLWLFSRSPEPLASHSAIIAPFLKLCMAYTGVSIGRIHLKFKRIQVELQLTSEGSAILEKDF